MMPKNHHHYLHSDQLPHKWFQVLCKLYLITPRDDEVKNGTNNTKIAQHIVGIVFAIATLFTMIIWLINIGYCFFDVTFSMKNASVMKQKKNPVIAWYNPLNTNSVINATNRHRRISCFNGSRFYGCDLFQPGSNDDNPDAYMFDGAWLSRVPLPRDPDTIWGLLHEETPSDRLVFMYEDALNLFNFSATFSRHSDVPLPLRWMRSIDVITNTTYFINTSMKNVLMKKFAPVIYLQSDWNTFTERDAYVRQLMGYIPIDSYGSCLNNKELPLDPMFMNINKRYLYNMYDPEMMNFLAQYKFIIAIENAVCNDYVTEKFWRAIEVGTVPIYYGSPLIRDWLPNNKSAILLEDFPTPELLSQHLHYLLQNDTAYEEYLEHKILKRFSNQNLINEMKARPYQVNIEDVLNRFECFVCEKLHDRDSRTVNMVTKKHFDCPLPTPALTLTANPNSSWMEHIKEARYIIDQLVEEINSPNRQPRDSETCCIGQETLRKMLGIIPW